MRVAYVGNFRPSHSTESHISATLEKMGHEVVRIQEDTSDPKTLVATIKGSDIFLFTRTWGTLVTMDHLVELREIGILSVSYHLDLYVGLKRDGGIDSDPFWRTDFVFTPDGDPESAKVFEAKDINHHYLKPGVYVEECYIADELLKRDIIFVGSYKYHPEWNYRQRLIDWLRRSYGKRFELWGATEQTKARGDALNRLYASTKIVIGDSLCLNFTHENYTSDRLFESTGRGAFLIYPRIKGLEDCFVEDKEVVYYTYGNFAELRHKINYYLRHDEEREAIRRAGHERAKKDHTYTKRLEEMFNIIMSEKKKG